MRRTARGTASIAADDSTSAITAPASMPLWARMYGLRLMSGRSDWRGGLPASSAGCPPCVAPLTSAPAPRPSFVIASSYLYKGLGPVLETLSNGRRMHFARRKPGLTILRPPDHARRGLPTQEAWKKGARMPRLAPGRFPGILSGPGSRSGAFSPCAEAPSAIGRRQKTHRIRETRHSRNLERRRALFR